MQIADKPAYFWANTLRDLRELPEVVRDEIGHGLRTAQQGRKAIAAKPLTGPKEFKGGKVLEIVSDFDGDTFRSVYTIEFGEAIHVLDVFQKKSKEGKATPKADIDSVIRRVKALRNWRLSAEGRAVIAELIASRQRQQVELDEQAEEKANALKQNKLRETSSGIVGSDNIFADLGLPDAETRLLKSKLVSKIDDVIAKRGLTQAEAGGIMGLPQPKVSELRKGRTSDYSVERLYRLLNNLGVGVAVVLESGRTGPRAVWPSEKRLTIRTPIESRPCSCLLMLAAAELFSRSPRSLSGLC